MITQSKNCSFGIYGMDLKFRIKIGGLTGNPDADGYKCLCSRVGRKKKVFS